MIRINFIKHKNCSIEQKIELSLFKKLNWDYPVESQLNWMSDNLLPDDIHVLLEVNNELVAYLNIVKLKITVNQDSQSAFGIGNVCVSPKYKGKSYGRMIMSVVDCYARQHKVLALLYCQQKNLGFYKSCGWNEVNNANTKCNAHMFTNIPIEEDELIVDREF